MNLISSKSKLVNPFKGTRGTIVVPVVRVGEAYASPTFLLSSDPARGCPIARRRWGPLHLTDSRSGGGEKRRNVVAKATPSYLHVMGCPPWHPHPLEAAATYLPSPLAGGM
ncbi:hypothetical protein Sjap_017668 [Stephania japonica]|uniref:Uncharacterized protein n=1 Tax=Stephania japonica TaxID=461633 RepID=A0AAP0I6R1_9MAGN